MAKREKIPDIENTTAAAKALAHPIRLRALCLLKQEELCLCELSQIFNLALPTTSRHMQILLKAGFIEKRRDHKWTYYFISKKNSAFIKTLMHLFVSNLKTDALILDDIKRKNAASCNKNGNTQKNIKRSNSCHSPK
jgi:ArsR family transcriptional regulator, arsenate/arsenite/antimonite-responsive transcriptional repressor